MSKELELARKCADAMYAGDTSSKGLGIEIEMLGAGKAEARMTVTGDMLNGLDVCHGGYVFTLADAAFAYACNSHGVVTVAGGASIDFLRPVKAGDRLVAAATERHRGRRSGICEVIVRNQDDEQVAIFSGRSVATGGSHLD